MRSDEKLHDARRILGDVASSSFESETASFTFRILSKINFMFPVALECRTSVSQFLDRDSTQTRDIGAKATLEIADSRSPAVDRDVKRKHLIKPGKRTPRLSSGRLNFAYYRI